MVMGGEGRTHWLPGHHGVMSVAALSINQGCASAAACFNRATENPGVVPIIRPLRVLLDAIRPPNAYGWIFPNSVGGALDLDNIAERVIKPVFKASGLDWKGWHAYRRGLATNLKKLGVPDTTIQAILRHESVSTTQRFYIKTAREDAMDAMKRFEEKLKCAAVVQQMVN